MTRKQTYTSITALLLIAAATVTYFEVRKNPSAIRTELPPVNIVLSVSEISDGVPPPAGGQLIRKSGFWLSYNEEFEQADWTAYILTRTMVMTGEEPRSDNFRADTGVTTGSAAPADYRGSGYDRGHLVPAADMKWIATSMTESFLMSNMSPQKPGFNRGIWRRLEEEVRDWAVTNDSIFVITGPIISDIHDFIGENHVAVPAYYFKIIVDISYPTYKGIAFLMENNTASGDLFNYAVTIDSIENLTGFDFFPGQEKRFIEYIESNINISNWK
jgi:endonuclease G